MRESRGFGFSQSMEAEEPTMGEGMGGGATAEGLRVEIAALEERLA